MVNHKPTSVQPILDARKVPMTYDQAANRASEMRARGVPYGEIEAFLKDEGYVSAKTRRPISAVGIRQMVLQVEARRERPREPIKLTNGANPEQDVVIAVTRIMAMDDINATLKVKLAKALLQ